MEAQPSEADLALLRFRRLRKDLLTYDDVTEWSESDTRSKLIDPIFCQVLGWTERDIKREEPSGDGYADYRIGSEYPYVHIEAKRSSPRFHIQAPSRARYLQLGGAHLLNNKDVRPHIEQAAKYGPDLGTVYAVLTNGSQFVLFQCQSDGKSWKAGTAVVFHDLEDIEERFSDFYEVFAADNVRNGSLRQALNIAGETDTILYRPAAWIEDYESELSRNPFWGKISQAVAPLLVDDPSDFTFQQQIVEHCYVTTALSDEVDADINRLLADRPSERLIAAGIHDLKPSPRGTSKLTYDLESDIKGRHTGTYILTGGVGSGKSTFLQRLRSGTSRALIDQFCVWVHIDFLDIGNVSTFELDETVRAFCFRNLRRALKTFPTLWPSDGKAVRQLFAEDLEEAKLTILHAVDPESPRYTEIENKHVDR